jgi:leucyl aminopeptidase
MIMVQIQQLDKANFSSNLLIVSNKKNKSLEALPKDLQKLLATFIESKKEFDYFKLGSHSIFFVKNDNNAEKLRIQGHNVRTKLDKEEKVLQLLGEDDNALLAIAEGFALANYQFLKYFKDKDKKINKIETISIIGKIKKTSVDELNATLEAVYWTRNMVNEPVSYLTASQLSKEIETIAENTDLKVSVFEKNKIEALKMGGLLAVNKGSIDPPTFTIVEYKPKKAKNKKPIVLVGKGVVYDTGGLSLKPTASSMDLMKSDMAGAACMAGTMYLASMLQLDLHLVALIPATDNRPGMNAYTPGDVITMFDGTTVEVLNTDAEGRMILADALAYSKKYDPELVIDAATLTGAAVVAIGTKASCIMGNADQKIIDQLVSAGNVVHERVVQLPFWDEYFEEMKSSIADLKNIGGRNAGMITAGKFLEHFVKAPYIHIDIAGPSFLEVPENYKGKGGTGVGVRLLTNFLKNYKA